MSAASGVFVAVRRSWVRAAYLVGRHATVLSVGGAAAAIYFAAIQSTAVIEAPSIAAEDEGELLRVCANPNNLPFSNDRLQGFENELAELVGKALNARVTYTWWAQWGGFIGNTVNAGECDVLLGVPSSIDAVLTTRPYYRSTYVFVWRADRPWRVESLDDPLLTSKTVGVQLFGDDFANAPPAHALATRGIVSNVRGYSVYADYSEDPPRSRIMEAVVSGEIDVAIAWGPLAGYFATQQLVPLVLQPVVPQLDLPFLPMAFDISMGVRRGKEGLRDRLDTVLVEHAAEIDALLERYAVPRMAIGRTAATE